MMTAYPAYTVARIDDELSWRQVGVLMKQWSKHPPAHVHLDRIERMIAAATGTKLIGKPNGHMPKKPETRDELVMRIMNFGMTG